ncbi:hypothetical protein [Bremerella cremea]|uniref:hypothetical protein n=1 Tax=Bremerella cremea TaxID=1031537 RepID=UPI0031E8CD85
MEDPEDNPFQSPREPSTNVEPPTEEPWRTISPLLFAAWFLCVLISFAHFTFAQVRQSGTHGLLCFIIMATGMLLLIVPGRLWIWFSMMVCFGISAFLAAWVPWQWMQGSTRDLVWVVFAGAYLMAGTVLAYEVKRLLDSDHG